MIFCFVNFKFFFWRFGAPKQRLSMQLCSGLRSIERLIFSLSVLLLLHNIIYKVGEEAAVRVEELVSKLQEYRRKEEEEFRKKKEEEEKGKTDVIGAIMAAIGEMPDTQTGERPTLDLVGKDLETVDDRMDVAQAPVDISDPEVVCIEEDHNNSTVKISQNASEGSGNINIVSEEEVLSLEEVEVTNLEEELTKMEEEVNNTMEGGVNNKEREVVTVEEEADGKEKEVDNMEELSFTAALEELGGLLDLCPT